MKSLYIVVDTQQNKILKVYRRYSSALNYAKGNSAFIVQEINYE